MNRILIFLVSLLVISMTLTGCRRDRQPDPMPEAEAETVHEEPAEEAPAVQAPTVPMCGDWVVIVESPTVAGNLDGDRITRALIEGLQSGGCPAHTAVPSGMPAGTPVLRLAPRIQSMGGTTINISVIATDAASGEVFSRHQERAASGDGCPEARSLGESIAQRLVN